MTVYHMLSASTTNQIERVALQNVLDDKPFGEGPKFPCRVLFRFCEPNLGASWPWYASCRGKDWKHSSGEGHKFWIKPEEALAWLKEEFNKNNRKRK